MCDGHVRVYRENPGLNRKRKNRNKMLLQKMVAMGRPGSTKACLALLTEIRVSDWREELSEHSARQLLSPMQIEAGAGSREKNDQPQVESAASCPTTGSKSDAPFSEHTHRGQSKASHGNGKYQSRRLAAKQVAWERRPGRWMALMALINGKGCSTL